MSMFDINFKLSALVALNLQTLAADGDVTGNSIDMNGAAGDFEALEFVLSTGNYTDGDFSFAGLEHSDDDAIWEAVDDPDDILGDNTAISADNAVSHIGYVGKKQFVRCIVNGATITTGSDISVLALRRCPRSAPLS